MREELSSDWFLHFSGVGLFIYLFILSLSSLPLSSLVLCSNSIIPELVVQGRHQSIKLMIRLDASTNLFIYLFVTSELSLFGSLGSQTLWRRGPQCFEWQRWQPETFMPG